MKSNSLVNLLPKIQIGAIVLLNFAIWTRAFTEHYLWQDIMLIVTGLIFITYGWVVTRNWQGFIDQTLIRANRDSADIGRRRRLQRAGWASIVAGVLLSLGGLVTALVNSPA
jgi:uncharacterized membrane protein YphA (DoxX/SURF4 family)